jgi:hypothetical protein
MEINNMIKKITCPKCGCNNICDNADAQYRYGYPYEYTCYDCDHDFDIDI